MERLLTSKVCSTVVVTVIIYLQILGNFVDRNYVRVVEVWWDEYSKYFYERKPNAKHVDPGDLTEVKAVRERLQCKSFDWFMKEIGYDLPKHFPLVEPSNAARGHITNVGTNLCVDGHHAGQGDQLALSECASVREGQWMLTWHEDIRPLSGSSK
jgi:polypeptide N-acetylgalactosaminyltransferase